MSSWYPKALASALASALDLTATVKMQPVDATVLFDPADEFLSDIPGGGALIGTAVALTGVTTTGGVFGADQPVAFVDVGIGDEYTGYVIYIDTGSSATSQLVLFFDRAGDSSLIDVIGDGGVVNVTATGGVFGSI